MLLLLSTIVIADRAGLVVQFSNSTVLKKCVEFQSGASAFELMQKSGLHMATKDYGGELGLALCGIEGTGCSADNCFCKSEYWGFYYMTAGNWEYSPVGISGFKVSNGDMLGFRWGAYGDKPELHSFSEICPSITQSGGGSRIRYFAIYMDGNCSKEPFVINVKDKEGDIIWDATSFFLSDNPQGATFEKGVGIRILLHQSYFGKDAGFEKVAMLFTDKEGNTSFIPEKPGKYRLEFEKGGFLRAEREIEIDECMREVVVVNKPIEELGSEKKEVELNVTRVKIIAPENAIANSTVVVKLLSEDGKPLVYENIIVEFTEGRKELITNESGEATFNASEEGVYSYRSPKYLMDSFKLTNVVKPTKVSLQSPVIEVVVAEEKPPSVGMATAGVSPEILGAAVVLIVVLLYLLQRVME
jgi:hypothetical protein